MSDEQERQVATEPSRAVAFLAGDLTRQHLGAEVVVEDAGQRMTGEVYEIAQASDAVRIYAWSLGERRQPHSIQVLPDTTVWLVRR